MEKKTGWGFTKNSKKLHYFIDRRSLCHGTKPNTFAGSVDGILKNPGLVATAEIESICSACVTKKQARERKSASKNGGTRGS